MTRKNVISILTFIAEAVLNSYAMLFFSKNKILALLILAVSFFIPATGFGGLIAVVISLVAAELLGFDRQFIRSGLYTYSSLLYGLGFATNFEQGNAFWILLLIGSLLTLFLSVAISARLHAKALPALSLGFIFSTWLMILASSQFSALGLTQRHIYWVNETYALGGQQLVHLVQTIEDWPLAPYIAGFFRSMSAIIFQGNITAGIILAIGLLVYSRIALLLMVYGYAVALLFSNMMGGFNAGDMTYYNMGTNFMLVSVALGGFYLVPSLRSFLWIFITVPIAFILVVGLGKVTYTVGLPVFSLPFCIVVILFLFILSLRKNPGKLVITPIQYYSPEINLYRYLNGRERLMNQYYQHISLPFMGEWMVSQGYNGTITHKGDWSKALDFVILDGEMKTYQLPGNLPEHFYCFNKPVLCPADGTVEEVVDHVEDNGIGKNNTAQNWGNTIVIKHAAGLYSKLSHLKKHSIKVAKGAFVYKGEIIAACGNSGRSPEPHLHFQLQATPYIGSKTLRYPIAYFFSVKDRQVALRHFTIPEEGSFVSNVIPNIQLQQAFNFQPGFTMEVVAAGYDTERWEVVTSVYNESYLWCREKNAYAYFTNNGTAFYFTSYFGTRKALLYLFYLSAYKVLLTSEKAVPVTDTYPLNVFGTGPVRWLQDFIAPFGIFIHMKYESMVKTDDGFLAGGKLMLRSKQSRRLLWGSRQLSQSAIIIENGQIQSFNFEFPSKKTIAVCKAVN